MIFGLPPAFGATRIKVVETLKGGGQTPGASITVPRIRNALLTAQVALALVLVIAAGLLVRSFQHMLYADAGFDASRVVTFELPVPSAKYSDHVSHWSGYTSRVLEQLQRVPGVRSAGFASLVPMGGASDAAMIRIQEHPGASDAANFALVSPGYFRPSVHLYCAGETSPMRTTSLPCRWRSSIRAMAKKYWPGEDPIGKQVAR